ncbi:hypothetical protein BBJ41_00770 [Burkholderia stabilis]|nr:hypothetical protein BBJ41_00770 [Burkholderia stabilis]
MLGWYAGGVLWDRLAAQDEVSRSDTLDLSRRTVVTWAVRDSRPDPPGHGLTGPGLSRASTDAVQGRR